MSEGNVKGVIVLHSFATIPEEQHDGCAQQLQRQSVHRARFHDAVKN